VRKIPASQFQADAALAYYRSSKDTFAGEPTTAGDDDTGEDGLDVSDPRLDGIRTATFTLAPGTAPTASSGETGFLAFEDDDYDANSDLTIDLGFAPKPLSVGNLVFRDLNNDGIYAPALDQAIAGVPLRLFRVGDNPQTATPVAMTLSSANGTYLLSTYQEGHYYVHIPASAFATGGPLAGATSVPGFGQDDGTDDASNEDGIDSPNPHLTGINSIAFHLGYGTEPVGSSENGALAPVMTQTTTSRRSHHRLRLRRRCRRTTSSPSAISSSSMPTKRLYDAW
jgi:hypothetical protein